MKTLRFEPRAPQIVAIVHSEKGWSEAREIGLETADLVEIRADLLQSQLSGQSLRRIEFTLPIILTVRSFAEGGAGPADDQERLRLFQKLLGEVEAVDVELASSNPLASVIDQAKAEQTAIIFSLHDFTGTPPLDFLREQIERAAKCGANLCKIATTLPTSAELCRLLQLLDGENPIPLAVMGMGKFGKVSRPLLAQAGSCLNYGYLDRPLVSGQWSAVELKRLIRNLEE